MEPNNVKQDLIPLFHNLVADEQDSVRLLAVEACAAIAALPQKEEVETLIVPTLRAASSVCVDVMPVHLYCMLCLYICIVRYACIYVLYVMPVYSYVLYVMPVYMCYTFTVCVLLC